MSERGSVRFGDAAIEYEVQRSKRRRKTVQITVGGGPSGGGVSRRIAVAVAAPAATPVSDLEAIVRKRAGWILRQAAPGSAAVAPKRFVSGETLPYLGRNVRMTVETSDGPAAEVLFDHWRFRVLVPGDLEQGERHDTVRGAFAAWYRERAKQRLPAKVARWWPRFGGGDPPPVLVRDQSRRWGSCAPDGTLRFNWRCVMLEPTLTDYIVAHEIAHLEVPNHSPAFWRHLASVMFDARHRRARLREAGLTLPL